MIVGPKEALETRRVYLRDVNWLGDEELEAAAGQGFECFAKVRSTRRPAPAVLKSDAEGLYVELVEGEAGVAPARPARSIPAPARMRASMRRLHPQVRARAGREAALKAILQAPAAA